MQVLNELQVDLERGKEGREGRRKEGITLNANSDDVTIRIQQFRLYVLIFGGIKGQLIKH